MRTLYVLLLLLISNSIFAQEITLKTAVNEATVFLDGAQVVRKKNVNLKKGTSILKFVNLSPYIDAKSIQVKALGAVTVLSVNHQQNYLDQAKKSEQLTNLEQKQTALSRKIEMENIYISIIKDKLTFLNQNRIIGGKTRQLELANLKQIAEYYGKQVATLRLKKIEHQKNISKINKQQHILQQQINTLANKNELPTGEIFVKISAKNSTSVPLELSYMVANAGWFPTYDIRAKNINEPIQIIYKANIKQNTQVDWNNVKLKFTSSNPKISGVAPRLKTYYLDYGTMPPRYSNKNNEIHGKVYDEDGTPLPGVQITVEGSTIGTSSDIDGNYNITIPNNANQLAFSSVGYETKYRTISGNVINVTLQNSTDELDEVIVIGYGSPKKSLPTGSASNLKVRGVGRKAKLRGTNSIAIPVVKTENATTVEFAINTLYTIKSGKKNSVIDMTFYDIPAEYQYYCVPKINSNVFLLANITNWEKYNLLAGEANLFFEGTYMGKTLLDASNATDTLQLSLGVDKSVSVQRKKVKDFVHRKFMGSKQEVTRAWETIVKNNKNSAINMVLFDQVPVSTNQTIQVNIEDKSKGKLNSESGEIKWKFSIPASASKKLTLKYMVKYPKSQQLLVE